MTTDSTDARAEATREAPDAADDSQLARARDGDSVTEAPEGQPSLPLDAVTERVQDWWDGVQSEVARAVEESRFGDLRERYAERVADSDAAVIRLVHRIYLWVVALPTKALLMLADMVTDWPGRAAFAVIVIEVFHWLLVGGLWFPW